MKYLQLCQFISVKCMPVQVSSVSNELAANHLLQTVRNFVSSELPKYKNNFKKNVRLNFQVLLQIFKKHSVTNSLYKKHISQLRLKIYNLLLSRVRA